MPDTLRLCPGSLPGCVIFDGDDTLWLTEELYDDARQDARSFVESLGFDGAHWEELERCIDVQNVATLGHSPKRFPTSCRQALEFILREQHQVLALGVSSQIERIALSVFERRARVLPGAYHTLNTLRTRGFRLGLLTKGDAVIQQKRIQDSKLEVLFDEISIVDTKSTDTVVSLIAKLSCRAQCTWVVGNSLRSDILPALAAGAHAIWIDAHVWEYERHSGSTIDDRVVRLTRMEDVLSVLKE